MGRGKKSANCDELVLAFPIGPTYQPPLATRRVAAREKPLGADLIFARLADMFRRSNRIVSDL
jgi:hypothetical protein